MNKLIVDKIAFSYSFSYLYLYIKETASTVISMVYKEKQSARSHFFVVIVLLRGSQGKDKPSRRHHHPPPPLRPQHPSSSSPLWLLPSPLHRTQANQKVRLCRTLKKVATITSNQDQVKQQSNPIGISLHSEFGTLMILYPQAMWELIQDPPYVPPTEKSQKHQRGKTKHSTTSIHLFSHVTKATF